MISSLTPQVLSAPHPALGMALGRFAPPLPSMPGSHAELGAGPLGSHHLPTLVPCPPCWERCGQPCGSPDPSVLSVSLAKSGDASWPQRPVAHAHLCLA